MILPVFRGIIVVTRLSGYLRATAALAFAALLGALLLGAAVLLAPAAAAQDRDTFTPMPLDAGFGPLDTSQPAIQPDEIIKRFAARESEFQQALSHYTWRREIRVQTINDAARSVDGEWYETDDITLDPDGNRVERTVYAPQSTLRRIMLSPSDMDDIRNGYPMLLTPEELPAYNIVYVGRQKVDAITCYVFDVSPKEIQKNHRYLQGRIWVDDQDFEIVITDGRMVPDSTKKGNQDLHPPFMAWREQVDGKYWFPTYVRSEGILHFAAGRRTQGMDVHIRTTIKLTGYKRVGSAGDGQQGAGVRIH